MRRFASGEVELLYRAGDAPSEVERLNAWLDEAGMPIGVRRLSPPGYGRPAEVPDERTAEENAERSKRRAKQCIRWSVKAIGCDQMLTLTYRDNVTGYAESRGHLSRFLALCRREWPEWRHVAAPERQTRGAWHWHIGVKGWQNYDRLRGFWWRAQGYKVTWSAEGKPSTPGREDTPGNVQGVAARARGRTRRSWSADRMAGYLAKYVSKSLGADGVEGKSYSVSRGLSWVTERYAVRSFTYAGVCSAVFGLLGGCGVVAPFLWQSPERRIVWAAGRGLAPPE